MEIIPLSDIKVLDERQRQFFDMGALIDLANDIKANGLLHPVVLRADSNILVAGERRLRAIEILSNKGETFSCAGQDIRPHLVPILRVSPRSEIGYYEAELSENAVREDLTWQEIAIARDKLHALRQRQNPTQTVKDTSEEVFGHEGAASIADDLHLARNLSIPEVAKAKTKKDAIKALNLAKQAEKNAKLADAFREEQSSSNTGEWHTLLHDEATSALPQFAAEQFDVILTDPPYGIGADTFSDQTFIDHHYDDSYEHWQKLMYACAKQFYRVAKPQAHAYIFCDINRFHELSDIMRVYGWDVWPRPLIWYKGNIGTLPRPKHGPRYTYEAILYAIKGNKEHKKVGHDVLSIPTSQKPRHAAEKPVPLYRELLSRSVHPGAAVLDPFCGTGTIFPAANALSCKATGIELVKENYGIASSRLTEDAE